MMDDLDRAILAHVDSYPSSKQLWESGEIGACHLTIRRRVAVLLEQGRLHAFGESSKRGLGTTLERAKRAHYEACAVASRNNARRVRAPMTAEQLRTIAEAGGRR